MTPTIEKCHAHELKLQKIESQMENLADNFHDIKTILEELKVGLRKQEDKSIVYDFIKVALGFVLCLVITNYVGQIFAPKNEEKYKTEKAE